MEAETQGKGGHGVLMASAAMRATQRERIKVNLEVWTTTYLKTFAKEKIQDGAGKQMVPTRQGWQEQMRL